MRFAAFAIAVAFLCSPAVAEQPLVTFVSPSECQGFHGKNRWVTKTDLSPVPLDKSAVQSVTPSQIYQWEGLGPDVVLTGASEERMPAEQTSAGQADDLKNKIALKSKRAFIIRNSARFYGSRGVLVRKFVSVGGTKRGTIVTKGNQLKDWPV